ncbi:hypothetical protein F511_28749 [Dorcoceras hygrometricum]|uniref:Uncharacterized protein n=1 Tax=Dorcoceras hygrometricum TaxID=472368 RepID=A0A2Z7BYW1_9LAMI|nr:hypothetical protein F511_28749 [Dorcoceras hygrometricum]
MVQESNGELLAGLTRLLEKQAEATRRVKSKEVYERFRNMSSKELSGTTNPLVAEDWIESLEIVFPFQGVGQWGKGVWHQLLVEG